MGWESIFGTSASESLCIGSTAPPFAYENYSEFQGRLYDGLELSSREDVYDVEAASPDLVAAHRSAPRQVDRVPQSPFRLSSCGIGTSRFIPAVLQVL